MSGSTFSYNLFLDENQQLRYSDNGPGSLISVGPEGAQMSSAPPGLAGDPAVCNGWMVFDTEGCAYLNEPLFLSGQPTLPDHAATKDYVDQAINGGPAGPFLPVTGGTATGPLVIDTTADPHNTAIPLTVRSGDFPEIHLYNLAGGGWPAVKMYGAIGGDCAYVEGNRVLGDGSTSTRWALELGTGHTESGGNVGTIFSLRPFSDTGSALPPAFQITRLGVVTWGASPQSTLQMTPGAATTNPFTLTATGTGGIQITGGTDARSLSINHSGGTIPVIASSVTNALQFAGAANESTGIGVLTFGTGNPTFSGVHAGGTLAAAAATPINSVLFAITGSGHDGTQYITPSRAQIQIAAAELWSATANGTDIRFLTTAATTLTRTEKLRLTSTGSLLLGVTGTNNTLTVTPGAAAANPVVLGLSGTAGVQVGSGTQNTLTVTPGSALNQQLVLAAPGTATTRFDGSGGFNISGAGGLQVGGATGALNSIVLTPGALITDNARIYTTGGTAVQIASKLNLSNIPTSATGLVAGDVWRNGTVLTIV